MSKFKKTSQSDGPNKRKARNNSEHRGPRTKSANDGTNDAPRPAQWRPEKSGQEKTAPEKMSSDKSLSERALPERSRPERSRSERTRFDKIRGDSPNTKIAIWGIHAVTAALANPLRKIDQLLLTKNAAQRIGESLDDLSISKLPEYIEVSPKDITKQVGTEPVHQGALLYTRPLAEISLEDLPGDDCVAVLDQVTDPHNVGAILRSAAAFGVSSLIMTQRNSPPLYGTLAKTASGGLERVNVILVPNLAQALSTLENLGYWRIGFEGVGESLMEVERPEAGHGVALILGAEEKGMRRLTREHCDKICRIHTEDAFASLNVSNAAAIAFHHFQKLPK